MKVVNVHERVLDASAAQVGTLLDSLASKDDALWPGNIWPRMRLDRPLSIGAAGGHGRVGYTVEDHQPGKTVTFQFNRPAGFNGWHRLEVLSQCEGKTLLRHTIEMRTEGAARLSWPLMFRPLHDALLEDALARAEAAVGAAPRVVPWSPWVRLLRWVFSSGKAPGQRVPVVTQPS